MKLNKKVFGNIIITGGAGFIGHHLIKKISNFSKKIFVIDNYSTGYNRSFPQNVILIKNCEDKKIFKNLPRLNLTLLYIWRVLAQLNLVLMIL